MWKNVDLVQDPKTKEWKLVDKDGHTVTTPICLKCQGLAVNDDPDACFGRGLLCSTCGYYRAPRKAT
jgi:hypothetical protein